MARMKYIFLVAAVFIILSGCNPAQDANTLSGNNPIQTEELEVDYSSILTTPTPAADVMSAIYDIPLEDNPEEPAINNGASYLFEWQGGLLYLDNRDCIWQHQDGGIISTARLPMAMDIYKNTIYYMEDNSSILRLFDLHTFRDVPIIDDVFETALVVQAGLFVVAENRIFYNNAKGNLCCAGLDGKNKTILSEKSAFNLKYQDGKIYYIGYQGEAYRIGIDGSCEEKIISENIDYYYLTQDSIVYQTAEGEKLYIKELDSDGSIEIIMEDELIHADMSSYEQFQLISVENGVVYYYKDTGDEFALYKHENGTTTMLTDLSVAMYVFPVVMIGDTIYCYAFDGEESGLFAVSKDGSSAEKIGDDFRMPEYYLD